MLFTRRMAYLMISLLLFIGAKLTAQSQKYLVFHFDMIIII